MLAESKRKNNLENIGELITNIFKKHWKENFVLDARSGQTLTYEDFFTRSLAYKGRLNHAGLVTNDTVVLILNNSLELMILYFAALLGGIRVVPMDPQKGINEILEILSLVDYDLLIIDSLAIKGFTAKPVITKEDFFVLSVPDLRVSDEEAEVFKSLDYEKVFLLTFTSGSTGQSKGVIHSFANLAKSALSFGERFNFGKENIFYHNLPMTYMAGILNLIFLPFLSGSKIVIGERFSISNIQNFWTYPIKYSANTFWFIPTIISLLLKIDRGGDGKNYTANSKIIGCVGTAPLDPRLKLAFEQHYRLPLYESYGLSETLFVATEQPGREKDGSVGPILDGVSLGFAADGEILIGADWMFLGYTNEKADGLFVDHKFCSGDLGELDKEGFLHITGRKKELIIRGGINISPKKIEDFVNNVNFFEEVVVLGFKDEVLGEKVVCFFVPKEKNCENFEKIINQSIIEKLGSSYRIDEFFLLAEIPRNINGKIDKLKLKDIYNKK